MAQSVSDIEAKRYWAERADATIKRGIKLFEDYNYVQTQYYSYEKFYFARFYWLKGHLESIRGEPLFITLRHYEKAHEISPNGLASTFFLAGTYYKLALQSAGPVSESLAKKSLAVFMHFIRLKSKDSLWNSKNLKTLNRYERDFAFLKHNVATIKKQYFE